MKGKASKKASKPAKKASKKPVKKVAPKKASKPSSKKPAKKAVKKVKPVKAKAVKKAVVKAHKPVAHKPIAHNVVGKAHPIKHKKKEDNRTRYSDPELKEFRLLIVEKLDKAKTELKYYQEQITRSADNSTDDTENRFGSPEDGTATMEREFLTQQAGRQYQYIEHLENALVRIENKTYGICRVTGKLIDKDRLRAVPHATMSIEAKLRQNKNSQPVVVVTASSQEESSPNEESD